MENLDPSRMMQHYGYGMDPATAAAAVGMHHHMQQQQQQHHHHQQQQQQQQQQEHEGAGPSANSDPRHQQHISDGGGGIRGHADICTILDQIMNITDQSLDEAQVSSSLDPAVGFPG